MLQDYEKFKRGKEVPQEAKFNTSNSIYWHKLSQTTSLTSDLLGPNPTNT
jgi:hypothetical protein